MKRSAQRKFQPNFQLILRSMATTIKNGSHPECYNGAAAETRGATRQTSRWVAGVTRQNKLKTNLLKQIKKITSPASQRQRSRSTRWRLAAAVYEEIHPMWSKRSGADAGRWCGGRPRVLGGGRTAPMCCGRWIRTIDLRVMGPASYYCSIPRCLFTELSKIALQRQSYEIILYLPRNQRVIRKVARKMDGSSQRYSAVIFRRDTL